MRREREREILYEGWEKGGTGEGSKEIDRACARKGEGRDRRERERELVRGRERGGK